MSSSEEEIFENYPGGGYGDELVEADRGQDFDNENPLTPFQVQRPANYVTPPRPQRRMPIQLSTIHTGALEVRQEASQGPALRVPSTPEVPQESSSPEISGSPDQGNILSSPEVSGSPNEEIVSSTPQEQRSPSAVLQSPSMSNNSVQDVPSPTVDSDIEDSSPTSTQDADRTGADLMPSIESPDVEDEEDSQATLDHGRSQVVTNDLYDVNLKRFIRAPLPKSSKNRKSIFGTPHNSNSRSTGTSSHIQTPKEPRQRRQAEVVAIESGSDDDCVFIMSRSARPGKPKISNPPPVVKNEPASDSITNVSTPKIASVSPDESVPPDNFYRESSPTEEEMIAAQASILGQTIRRTQSEEEVSAGPVRDGRKRRRESMTYPEDQADVDNAMQVDEDDYDWMHDQEDGGDDSKEEFENLVKLRNALSKELDKGTLDFAERAELIRVNHTLAKLDRLKTANARGAEGEDEDEDEESLFVPEERYRRFHNVADNGEGPSSRPGDSFEDIYDDDAGLASMLQEEFDDDPSKKKKPKRKRQAPAKNAREFQAREQAKILEKEKAKSQKQKQKAGSGSGKGGKTKAGRKGKGRGKEKEKRFKKGAVKVDRNMKEARFMGQRGGQDDVGQLILDDLMNSDAIGDRLQDPIFNCAPEPELGGTRNKATQLQQLFANIPEGSSKTKGKSDKAKLLQASRSFGYAQVKAINGKWLVKGMKSTLYHHQLLGAQWMVSRELSTEPPHGGLLADSMGLGKTVQTLACMVGNPPTEEDRKRGVTATLIVVPSSVISQWLEEIRNHVHEKAFPKVMQYKASMNIPENVLKDLDIVVTSYTEVMKQFPFPDRKGREDIARYGYKKWWKNAHDQLGDLHKINWRRVVLDEAHAIKNNSARTSLACQNLKSVYRWCLTGTPLLNRLEELFPYLRFLKANYAMDWRTFQQYFCDPDADDCNNRITTLLSYAMMRRTMKTTILNRPIITLPKPHPVMQQLNFSREERIIYRITENRFRANLNVFLANGTAQRAYGVFFVQLLRLRQCTSHPFMLERTMRESWTTEDVERLRKELGKFKDTNVAFYEQCKLWVTESEEERAETIARGEKGAEAIPFGLSKFGESFKFDSALDSLNEEELYTRITCHLCSDVPNEPVITDCSHIFCQSCLDNHLHTQMHLSDGDDTFHVCPKCDIIFNYASPYKDLEIPDDDGMDSGHNQAQESESSSRASKRRKPNNDNSRHTHGIKSKGLDALDFEPFTKDNTWVTRSDYDPKFPLIPSAKTTALKALLLKGFEEAPDDKVVIYVQFRTLARIIGRMCEAEGWGFLYLTGDASLEHRSKATKAFRNRDDIQILIAGLKCGGLGLNFPFANRCISLDLWWNHAVEQQAFGRIFRIGQNKETWMTRLVVANSVDMRLLGMQNWKLKACEKAIDNNGLSGASGSAGGTLNLSQLARLFGFLKTDEDNNLLRIEPDYEDGEDAMDGGGA
ncbi:hypothetical protein BOTNAR_0029g00400 [Botryotinia narcissicola]|uniref:Uncharacterized protein n=1 Tax=Botryotinia narcissicola TaxID=278944 RepID=A0A4Z1J9L6_9HELO|nr:hypothetical protein BOTNAR_0029g00400 [Botryotinia narcissicola]